MKGRREEIIEAARDLFLAVGREGMSMRRVADAVGISAPAIYRHFPSKEALLSAVVADGRQLLVALLFQALDAQSPLERLRLTGEKYLEFAFKHPEYYQVFFMSAQDLKDVVGQGSLAQPPPTLRFLFDRVGECGAAGLLGTLPEFHVAMCLWAQCHGLAALYAAGGARNIMPLEQYQALASACMELALRALKKPPP